MPARKRTTNESDLERQKREAQLEEINQIISTLNPRVNQIRDERKQLFLLDSVSKGLYDEIDKLSKKAPADSITDLVLNQMNEIIRETKELAVDDVYVQRLDEFISAGDNPEHRDAVVVLRQIRQGLERYSSYIDLKSKWAESKIKIAKGIQFALKCHLQSDDYVTKNDMDYNGFYVSDEWLVGDHYNKRFDFKKLDIITLEEYFREI